MKMQKQLSPNCLVYSAAMLLDTPALELFEEIGHFGQDVYWPELPAPKCFRGVHIQEIIDCFLRRGSGLIPIDLSPASSPYDDGKNLKHLFTSEYNRFRYQEYLDKFPALLILPDHACAWDNETKKVFDPNGFRKSIEEVKLEQIWLYVNLI